MKIIQWFKALVSKEIVPPLLHFVTYTIFVVVKEARADPSSHLSKSVWTLDTSRALHTPIYCAQLP